MSENLFPDQPDDSWDRQNQMQKAERVLTFLNKLTKAKYKAKSPAGDKPTAAAKLVIDRIKEGYNKDDFEQIIRAKCDDWSGDDKMRQYLRPSTLFRKSNFEQYYAAIGDSSSIGAKIDVSQKPDAYLVLENFLADHKRRGGSWGFMMPESPAVAASWWINDMQEAEQWNEKPVQVESRKKKGKKIWQAPHVERVLHTLRLYLQLDREDQVLVYGCIDDGVPWRGDSMEVYVNNDHSIYNETMTLRQAEAEFGVEGTQEYINCAKRRAGLIAGGMQ